jgi:hypothetical protein
MKNWDSAFMSPHEAKLLGDARANAYVAFKDLSSTDQRRAVSQFPHKNVGLKYDFPDEHYYYPVKKDGSLGPGRRVLAIPHAKIMDDEYMSSLGYKIKPGWHDREASKKTIAERVASRFAAEGKEPASEEARAATNVLYGMQSKVMWNAFTALQEINITLRKYAHLKELHPEIQEVQKHYEAAYKAVQDGNDALGKIFKKMGWT